MARHETDREDLLREATALVERAELSLAGEPQSVTVGFRRDGSLSVFFGGEAVYQFNSARQLRRAYLDGLLYKADRGRLVALRRERTASHVALLRRELSEAETTDLLAAAGERLGRLRAALEQGTFALVGEVSQHGHVARRVGDWLAELPSPLQVAARPNVG